MVPPALKIVLRYANAHPTARNWRAVVLGPFRHHFVPKGSRPPEVPTFGVESLTDLESILTEFRGMLLSFTTINQVPHATVDALTDDLFNRANLQLQGLSVDHALVQPIWGTAHDSFSELLYSSLAIALQQVRAPHIRQCAECSAFFHEPSQRRTKYCSKRCRDRVLVRRYRQRHPERYRAYQRDLMRRRQRRQAGRVEKNNTEPPR